MKTVFADTAYFLALVSQHDRLHEQAMALAKNPPGDLFTTEWMQPAGASPLYETVSFDASPQAIDPFRMKNGYR